MPNHENERTLALALTGTNSSPQADFQTVRRTYLMHSDGTRELVSEQSDAGSSALVRDPAFLVPPSSISAADVAGAVPELAGAWEAEVHGHRNSRPDMEMSLRVGLEFDATGRFSRVRVPRSTGYLAVEPIALDSLRFLVMTALEYRPQGARLVMEERGLFDCKPWSYWTLRHEFDISAVSGVVTMTVHQSFTDHSLGYDAVFDGAGQAEMRSSAPPDPLTGCVFVTLTGTEQRTEYPDGPHPIVHDPEPATRTTHLCMDERGRVMSISSASDRGFYGEYGTGNVLRFSPFASDVSTESGFFLDVGFGSQSGNSNTHVLVTGSREVFTYSRNGSVGLLTADVDYTEGERNYGSVDHTLRVRFTGAGELGN